jgi:hypothetical protein
MTEVTDADTNDTGSVIGNGFKVALIAGGLLGAGLLFWRVVYGKGDSDEKKTEAEAQAAPATAAAVAPSASCACHGAPPIAALPPRVDANMLAMLEALEPHGEPVLRVGNQWLTLPEVRRAVLQRVAA